MERDLMAWKRKILRKIYGLSHENGCWGKEINREIKNKIKYPHIVTVIKVRSLE
jgi:hypothetical protein